MSLYPIMMHGESIAALVVGGGPVAARKARALLETGASVHVVAPEQCDELRSLAGGGGGGERRLRLTGRGYSAADLAGATLVIAATDDRLLNEAIGRDARAAGLLVNVADAPDEGSFVTAATHRSGPLLVAVSAGGVPTAASRLRDLIAQRIDDRYGDAVALLAELRGRLMARGDAAGWRRAAAQLTGGTFVELVESGQLAERVKRWE